MSYAASEAEALESEGFEAEAFGEYGEAAGRRGRLPRTASGRGLAPLPQMQQSKNFVTYAALRQAMDKVGAQIKTNSDAISGVGSKLNATAASLKKEFDDRKKDSDAIRSDINQKTSMLALLPLIMTPPTYSIAAGTPIGVDSTGNVVLAATNTGLAATNLASGAAAGAGALSISPPATPPKSLG